MHVAQCFSLGFLDEEKKKLNRKGAKYFIS